MTMVSPSEQIEITERCDSCPSKAVAYAVIEVDLPLFFCRHHYNKHAEALNGVALYVTVQAEK